VNGPFQTPHDAARFSDFETFSRKAGKTMADANLLQLLGELSGVELGGWDREVLTWVASQEPSAVAAICGLIHRARQP